MEPVPVLSVIIPVHNSEATLKRCVESVLAQDASFPIEIILVENGSEDSSPAICRRIAASHPEIKAVASSRIGVSEARNLGVTEAKGRCVTFVDADDYVEPDMYRRMMEVKERYGVGIVSCNFINNYPDGSTRRQFPDTGRTILRSASEATYDILMGTSSSSPCIYIFDREFLLSRKFPEGVRFEDHAVMFEWMSECGQTANIDLPFYHYYHHAGSYTSDAEQNPEKIRDYLNAELKRIRFIRKYPSFSYGQRREALRKAVGQAVLALKRLTGLLLLKSQTDELAIIRKTVLDELSEIRPAAIGFSRYVQYLRIRHLWDSFAKKQQRKMQKINS